MVILKKIIILINQIKKLYSKIGNDILNEYKGYKTEIFLNNQKEFLSKNIFKLNLKTNNNITDDKKIELGVSLYKIANYNNLSTFQTKRLIKIGILNLNLMMILKAITILFY